MNAGLLCQQTLDCLIKFVLYIIPCVAVLLLCYFVLKIKKYIFRKLLHLVAFSCVTLMIEVAESWQAAAAASLVIVIVVYPLLSAFEKAPMYSSLFVEKSKGEVKRSLVMLFGMFAVLTAASWGVFGKRIIGEAAILMWGFGDAAAALVGIPFGKHKVRCRLTDGKKSYEGTCAMLAASFAAGFIFLSMRVNMLPAMLILPVLAAAVPGALTELFSPSEWDTVTVPAVILAVMLILL